MPTSQTANLPPPGTPFIPRLEALRGVAALTVAAFHASTPWKRGAFPLGPPPEQDGPFWGALYTVYAALCNGQGAVILFFVLSGFVLALSLEREFARGAAVARRFFLGRLFRIYPAVVVTVLLFVAVFWLVHGALPDVTARDFRPAALLRNALLLGTRIDGVMWSLQLEVVATPLILLAAALRHRWGLAPVVTLALLLIALSFVGQWDRALGPGRAPLRLLHAFALGTLIPGVGRGLGAKLGARAERAVFGAAVCLFVAAQPVLPLGWRWGPICEALAAAALIAILSYGQNTDFARPLDWPFLRFCGRVSYSFYLLHPLTLIAIWNIPTLIAAALGAGVPSVIVALTLAVATVGATLPLAWLSWRFVERPGIALGRRFADALTARRSGVRAAI